MQTLIKNVNINYVRYGNSSGKSVIYLHGWGQNIAMMKPVADPFSEEFDIVILDLPGFGESEEPKVKWTLNDYVDCVHELLLSLNIENPIIVGHSFGGKLGLLYASKYKVSKLVLFASPYKKEIKKLSMKTKILKSLKHVPVIKNLEGFAKKHIGSTDYKNASSMMRDILVEHVNTDLTDDVKKIKCPTLILWGTADEAVNVDSAYELEELIRDAGVVIYDGCTHYAYLERLNQTINVLWNFY